jgi:hypothetical protein
MKFKIGDVVEVVGNGNGHHFELGEKVIVASPIDEESQHQCYKMNESDYWYVLLEDLKPIKEAAPTKEELLNAGFEERSHIVKKQIGGLLLCVMYQESNNVVYMTTVDAPFTSLLILEGIKTKDDFSDLHESLTGEPLNFEKKEEKVEWKRGNVLKNDVFTVVVTSVGQNGSLSVAKLEGDIQGVDWDFMEVCVYGKNDDSVFTKTHETLDDYYRDKLKPKK